MTTKDVNVELSNRKKIIESESATLSKEAEGLIEQGKKMNQRLAEINTRQVQLQGEQKVCIDLLGESKIPKKS